MLNQSIKNAFRMFRRISQQLHMPRDAGARCHVVFVYSVAARCLMVAVSVVSVLSVLLLLVLLCDNLDRQFEKSNGETG